MKQSEKIKVSIYNTNTGTYGVRIEYPNGKQDRKEMGYSLFGRAIAMNKKLDSQFSEGNDDFYLTEAQYTRFTKRLIEFN